MTSNTNKYKSEEQKHDQMNNMKPTEYGQKELK